MVVVERNIWSYQYQAGIISFELSLMVRRINSIYFVFILLTTYNLITHTNAKHENVLTQLFTKRMTSKLYINVYIAHGVITSTGKGMYMYVTVDFSKSLHST